MLLFARGDRGHRKTVLVLELDRIADEVLDELRKEYRVRDDGRKSPDLHGCLRDSDLALEIRNRHARDRGSVYRLHLASLVADLRVVENGLDQVMHALRAIDYDAYIF